MGITHISIQSSEYRRPAGPLHGLQHLLRDRDSILHHCPAVLRLPHSPAAPPPPFRATELADAGPGARP